MKKVLGIAMIVFGILGLFVLIVDFNLLSLISSGVLIFLGRGLAKSKKTKNNTSDKKKGSPTTSTYSPKITKPSKANHIFFNVVGISKKNDKGRDIQSLIRAYVDDELEMEHVDAYEDLTNKEILEDDLEVFEVDISGDFEIELDPEPDNPYDPNAIKVIHDEIGHIGYVPKEMTMKVKEAIDNDADLEWRLIGGKMKYVDSETDKVKTKTLTYGVTIDLYY